MVILMIAKFLDFFFSVVRQYYIMSCGNCNIKYIIQKHQGALLCSITVVIILAMDVEPPSGCVLPFVNYRK